MTFEDRAHVGTEQVAIPRHNGVRFKFSERIEVSTQGSGEVTTTMKPESFATLPGQEPVWNMAPGRKVALKLQNQQTGQNVMAFEEVAPRGTATPLHLHHDSDEVMYILSGQFSFKVGDQTISGGPGTCVFMPRGVPHAWKYVGDETGRAFICYTPGEAGKAFEEAVTLQGATTPAISVDDNPFAPLGDAEILDRHGWELVGPPPF